MYLLDLVTGGASLEFSPAEKASVMDGLREFGPILVRHESTYDVISVGGEQLTYLDEWDQPCLIAASAGGKALLSTLARDGGLSAAAE